MRVTISSKVSKKLAKRLSSASNFFAGLLMDPRMVRDLKIEIKLLRKLEGMGFCEVIDSGKPRRKYIIEILNDGQNDPIETLAHEMVHVKQYAKKEIGREVPIVAGTVSENPADYITQWKGKFWNPKSKEDPYFDSPWEIEAYGRGFGLYERWQDLNPPKPVRRAKRKPKSRKKKTTK